MSFNSPLGCQKFLRNEPLRYQISAVDESILRISKDKWIVYTLLKPILWINEYFVTLSYHFAITFNYFSDQFERSNLIFKIRAFKIVDGSPSDESIKKVRMNNLSELQSILFQIFPIKKGKRESNL